MSSRFFKVYFKSFEVFGGVGGVGGDDLLILPFSKSPEFCCNGGYLHETRWIPLREASIPQKKECVHVCACMHACVREERHLRAVYTAADYSIRHTGEEELGGLTLQILANTNTGNWF